MALSQTINYDTPGNFTYNASFIDIVSNAQLKSLAEAKELCYFNFNTAADTSPTRGSSGGATLQGVPSSTADISGGKLNFYNSNTSRARLDKAYLNISEGEIHFKFTPNFNTIVTDQCIFNYFSVGSTSGASEIRMNMQNQGGGITRIWFKVYDSSGVQQINSIVHTVSFVSGTEYDFRLSYDFVTGDHKFYFDGVEVWTDSTTVTMVELGDHTFDIGEGYASFAHANFKMDDLRTTNAKYTDGAFSVPVAEFFTYSQVAQTIIPNSDIDLDGLESFSESAVIPANSQLKYAMRVGGVDMYWDGAAWVASDLSLAQSNTAAEIETNKASLISTGTSLKPVAVVSSTDGYATPVLTSLTIEYNFFQSQTPVDTCVIWGYVIDGILPVAAAEVNFRSRRPQDINGNFVHINTTVVSDANGYFEASLPETATEDQKIDVMISYTDSQGQVRTRSLTIIVPNAVNSSLEDAIAA
jgi:hypothetical protein